MLQALTLGIIALLVGVDQLIKAVMYVWLRPQGVVSLLPGFIQFRYVENTGAAFGTMQGNPIFLAVVTLIVIAVGLYFLFSGRIKPVVLRAGIILALAGGTGNLIDRLFRHYVIDFIEPLFVNFAVFNFADILVTTGAALFIGYLIYDLIADTRRSRKEKIARQERDS